MTSEQLLSEAIAWCMRHARATEAGSTTRSPALKPPVMSRSPDEALERLLNVPGEAKVAVDFVCDARRHELKRLNIPVEPVGEDLASGRIMYTTMDSDLCGMAIAESNGLFDDNDLPGWDTWFYYRNTERPWGAIYCWVPATLVSLAEEGMDAIPVGSVRWAESLEELST